MHTKTLLTPLLLAVLLLCGCGARLEFRPGEEGVWTVPDRQMDRWAAAIHRADDTRARQLLDEGYTQADSLSAGEEQARTLEAFALAVADRFLNLNSPYYDEHAYDLALEREALCKNWSSWGRRGMDWRKALLNLNRAGTRVCDFWLSKGAETPDTLLRKLLPGVPLTVLFLYGENCAACEELIGQIGGSRRFPALAAEGSVQFVSLYTGEDPEEYRTLSARLPEYWDNWYDRENVVKYDRAFDNRMVPSLYIIDDKEIVQLRGARTAAETEKFLDSR